MDNVSSTQKHETSPNEVERTHTLPTYVPATDIYQKGSTIIVVADMPGVDESSIDIHLEKGILTLRGSMSFNLPEGYRLNYAEFGPGVYERSFSVANDIDTEKIEANVKDGILTVTLPKAESAQPKKITVKVEK